MKDLHIDANFPRTVSGRVYHLGLRPGEIANRILTVGSPSRAQHLATLLDASPTPPFKLLSERGFLTITGRFSSVPVSIVSIGMGSPNMDIFVREVRECIEGDMVVVRLGSCGALIDLPVGSVVVPKASVAVTRNLSYNFGDPTDGSSSDMPYHISKPADADPALHSEVLHSLERNRPASPPTTIIGHAVNASTDSFYSSQGRQTSFLDHNQDLIGRLKSEVPNLATLEMETFHLFHLSSCWRGHAQAGTEADPTPLPLSPLASTPLTTTPLTATSLTTAPLFNTPHHVQSAPTPQTPALAQTPNASIKAAAAHLVFASRGSRDFISPEQVQVLEAWAGRAVLEALTRFVIEPDLLHPVQGSVWEVTEVIISNPSTVLLDDHVI